MDAAPLTKEQEPKKWAAGELTKDHGTACSYCSAKTSQFEPNSASVVRRPLLQVIELCYSRPHGKIYYYWEQ